MGTVTQTHSHIHSQTVEVTQSQSHRHSHTVTVMERLESRIRELEIELCSSQRRTGDTRRIQQREERRIMELQGRRQEDQRNMGRMEDLVSGLERQCRKYKDQILEAEEIAALNLAKYRKAQQELEEAEQRARMAEEKLGCARIRNM